MNYNLFESVIREVSRTSRFNEATPLFTYIPDSGVCHSGKINFRSQQGKVHSVVDKYMTIIPSLKAFSSEEDPKKVISSQVPICPITERLCLAGYYLTRSAVAVRFSFIADFFGAKVIGFQQQDVAIRSEIH